MLLIFRLLLIFNKYLFLFFQLHNEYQYKRRSSWEQNSSEPIQDLCFWFLAKQNTQLAWQNRQYFHIRKMFHMYLGENFQAQDRAKKKIKFRLNFHTRKYRLCFQDTKSVRFLIFCQAYSFEMNIFFFQSLSGIKINY